MRTNRLLTSSLIGALDQAVLSLFSLATAFVFIRISSKSEYALFVLATTVILLAQSLQNALVSSPLMTLLPSRLALDERSNTEAAAMRVQGWLIAACLVVGMWGLALPWVANADQRALVASLCLACVGALMREFARTRAFVNGHYMIAFGADLLFVLLGVLGLAVLVVSDWLTASHAFAVIGAAGVLCGLSTGIRTRWPFRKISPLERAQIGELWRCSRWALPSVVVSWLYANAFLFVVELFMSSDAVADIAASKLLLVPLSLIVVGWTNAFRPRAGRWYARGLAERVHSTAVRSAWALVVASVLYGVALYAVMPWLVLMVLPASYEGSSALAVCWLAFFMIGSFRGVGMASMLVSARAFRPLFVYGVVALLIALPAVTVASIAQSSAWVLLGLTAAEAALAMLIWQHGWPRIRRASQS